MSSKLGCAGSGETGGQGRAKLSAASCRKPSPRVSSPERPEMLRGEVWGVSEGVWGPRIAGTAAKDMPAWNWRVWPHVGSGALPVELGTDVRSFGGGRGTGALRDGALGH